MEGSRSVRKMGECRNSCGKWKGTGQGKQEDAITALQEASLSSSGAPTTTKSAWLFEYKCRESAWLDSSEGSDPLLGVCQNVMIK